MLRNREVIRNAILLTAIVLVFVGGLALSRGFDLEMSVSRRGEGQIPSSGYSPVHQATEGSQLELVYIGAATCGWSNQEGLPDAVNMLKSRISEYAAAHQMTFKATGVALDWQPERGVEHLAKFGPFDEISSGYNWGNTLALRDVWDPEALNPQTPQLILFRREFFIAKDSVGPDRYFETNRTRIETKIGSVAILEWASEGADFSKLLGETM